MMINFNDIFKDIFRKVQANSTSEQYKNFRELYLSRANGVRHTKKINSYTQNLTKKGFFVHKVIFFISKKVV